MKNKPMKNLFLPLILAHSLVIRIAFIFPVFRVAIALLLISETLLLLAFGGFSRSWEDKQKLYLILLFAGFIAAIFGGV